MGLGVVEQRCQAVLEVLAGATVTDVERRRRGRPFMTGCAVMPARAGWPVEATAVASSCKPSALCGATRSVCARLEDAARKQRPALHCEGVDALSCPDGSRPRSTTARTLPVPPPTAFDHESPSMHPKIVPHRHCDHRPWSSSRTSPTTASAEPPAWMSSRGSSTKLGLGQRPQMHLVRPVEQAHGTVPAVHL